MFFYGLSGEVYTFGGIKKERICVIVYSPSAAGYKVLFSFPPQCDSLARSDFLYHRKFIELSNDKKNVRIPPDVWFVKNIIKTQPLLS